MLERRGKNTLNLIAKYMKEYISAVPTNIITGFLGVGKTSAILHLLKQKPSSERWAVLVNEFGEIGVDGSLVEGRHSEKSGVFIREVPGGCMCCAAGLPMQIALNQLLTRAKPDRLLIEPTGLGHPEEVLEVLAAEHYQEVLELHNIVTLVDARKLADERYTTHQTFNQQIAIADIVVGNKLDLYQAQESDELKAYVQQCGAPGARVVFTQGGEIAPSYLLGKTAATAKHHHDHHHSGEKTPALSEEPIPECGYIRAVNEGEGFRSVGWRFSPETIFSHTQLFSFLSGISAERMKAVFITEKGVFGYNLTPDALTEVALDDCMESRVEIIAEQVNEDWEVGLMQCISPQP